MRTDRRAATLVKSVSAVSDDAAEPECGARPPRRRLGLLFVEELVPRCGVLCACVGAAWVVWSVPLVVYAWVGAVGAAAAAWGFAYLALPRYCGVWLSRAVSRFALHGAVDMEFRAPRVCLWFDVAWRLHLQLNVEAFRFGQPKVARVRWCQADLLTASDVVVHVSMEPRDVLRPPASKDGRVSSFATVAWKPRRNPLIRPR